MKLYYFVYVHYTISTDINSLYRKSNLRLSQLQKCDLVINTFEFKET